MKDRRLLWLSIGLGTVFWLCDAAVDVWLFEQQRHFLAEVFTSEPEEVRLRLVVWGLFAVIGYYGQRLITALQTARDELQQRVQERTQELEVTNIALSEEVAERKQTEAALKTLSRTVQASQEEERQRIARELHDEVGQTLTMIKLNLQLVQDNVPGAETNAYLTGESCPDRSNLGKSAGRCAGPASIHAGRPWPCPYAAVVCRPACPEQWDCSRLSERWSGGPRHLAGYCHRVFSDCPGKP